MDCVIKSNPEELAAVLAAILGHPDKADLFPTAIDRLEENPSFLANLVRAIVNPTDMVAAVDNQVTIIILTDYTTITICRDSILISSDDHREVMRRVGGVAQVLLKSSDQQ